MIGDKVSPANLIGVDVAEGVTAVWGEDWSGKPVMRAVRPGIEVVLRGEFGHGFDLDGPVAGVCGECAELLISPTSGHHTMTIQRHYATHGQTLAMLP